MEIVRMEKEGKSKFVSPFVLDAKISDFKADGWTIDPKPYLRSVTAKGVVYTLDKEAWDKEEEMRARADKDAEPNQEEAEPKKTPRKKKEE